MNAKRTSIYAAIATLLCAAGTLSGQADAPAPQRLRVRLVHADPAAPVDTPEMLRALAVITFEVAAPDVKGAELAANDRVVEGHIDNRPVFTIELVERSKGETVVSWVTGLDTRGALDPATAAAAVDRVTKLVAQGAPMPKEARRAQAEALRREREAIRGKQSILNALVRGQAKTRREGLNARLAQLDVERERLEIDLAAANARSRAMQKQMDQIQAEAENRARNDPIQEQLQRLLKLRMEELKRAKDLHAQGSTSASEVSAVEGRVADAEIQLLTRREQVIHGDEKGDLIARLANELAMIQIDRAEKEERLNYILQRLPQLDPKTLDEKTLDEIAEKYPTLVGADGDLPPLYYELEKRQAELLKKELGLLVSDVKVERNAATAPAR